jgi:two-component system, NarL family, response regulator NreC
MINTLEILLVDDHPIYLEGLSYLLKDVHSIKIVGTAKNGKEALTLLNSTRANIVLMDIRMPVMDGIEATSIISNQFAHIKTIGLTAIEKEGAIKKMFDAGACGCISKHSSLEDILTAIATVVQNKLYYFGEVFTSLDEITFSKDKLESFTSREKEILNLIALGRSSNEIAEYLNISPLTVKSHRANIMKKANASSKSELLCFAIEHKNY